MSQYVVLIRADCGIMESTGKADIHAIAKSSNPATGFSLLQAYCPVRLMLIHSINAGNRTTDLERILHIKYRLQSAPYGNFWFILTPEDVRFIQSINEDNLTHISGMIKRQESSTGKALPAEIQKQLDICTTLLES